MVNLKCHQYPYTRRTSSYLSSVKLLSPLNPGCLARVQVQYNVTKKSCRQALNEYFYLKGISINLNIMFCEYSKKSVVVPIGMHPLFRIAFSSSCMSYHNNNNSSYPDC